MFFRTCDFVLVDGFFLVQELVHFIGIFALPLTLVLQLPHVGQTVQSTSEVGLPSLWVWFIPINELP